MRLIPILAWIMTIFKCIVSNKDAVAYVDNPVESGFPSHWLPVSIIKRIMENRVRTTDEDYYYPKVKLLLNYTRKPLFHVRRGTTTKQTPLIATIDTPVRNVTITKNVTILPATLKATAGTFTTTKLETDKIEPSSLSQSENHTTNHTTTPKLFTNMNTVVFTKPIAFILTTELTINTLDSNYDHTTTSMQDNTTTAARLIQMPTLTPTESTTKKVLATTKSMTTSTIEVPTTTEVTTTTIKAPTATAKVTTTTTTEEPTTTTKVTTKTSHVLATTTKETTATTTDVPKTTTEMLTTTTLLLTTTTMGTTATTESGNPFY